MCHRSSYHSSLFLSSSYPFFLSIYLAFYLSTYAFVYPSVRISIYPFSFSPSPSFPGRPLQSIPFLLLFILLFLVCLRLQIGCVRVSPRSAPQPLMRAATTMKTMWMTTMTMATTTEKDGEDKDDANDDDDALEVKKAWKADVRGPVLGQGMGRQIETRR